MAIMGDIPARSSITDIKQVMQYVYALEDQIRYALSHIGGENIVAGSITGRNLAAGTLTIENFAETLQQTLNIENGKVRSEIRDIRGNQTIISQQMTGLTAEIENADGKITEIAATVNGLRFTVEDAEGRMNDFQVTLNDLALALSDENGRSTALQATVEGLLLLFQDQENLNAYLRVTENGLEIGREGDPAKFRADNRTLEVTNLKTERVSITQSMSQDAEWAWIATKSGLGLKYIG